MSEMEPIAIVGMSCRFPGAPSLAEYWDLLREGRSSVGPAPADRFLEEKTNDGGAPLLGGYLDDPYGFDARAFEMSPGEARQTDPQQRLLLELAWEALEDAGITRAQVSGSTAGVFMGVSWCDYRDVLSSDGRVGGYGAPGALTTFAANRVSRFFDLRGPSFSFDAACASSLVAIHQAVTALRARDCTTALVGGAELMLARATTDLMAKTGVLSKRGQCRAFDAKADGFVRGEGAGVIVLKPLSLVAPGERVHALIAGSAVQHNGSREWFLRSSAESLCETVRRAWARAAVTNEEVDYVEMHGVATRQGDDAEIAALTTALVGRIGETCRVGSVKSNLGNLGAASGMAGVIKTVLCLERRRLVPSIHVDEPAALLAKTGMLEVQRVSEDWTPRLGPRTAGVSAASLGGCNAHVVLRQAPEVPREGDGQPSRCVVAVSARERSLLPAQVRRLLESLEDDEALGKAPLADVSTTSLLARHHWPSRLAIFAESREDLVARLSQWLRGPGEDAVLGAHPAAGDPDFGAAEAFVRGETVDLGALARGGRIASLPPTLWKRQTLRLDGASSKAAAAKEAPHHSTLDDRLRECGTQAARQQVLEGWILDQLTDVLPGGRPEPADGFFEKGLQSAQCLDLLAALGRELGVHLPETSAFTSHSARLLSAYAEELWAKRAEAPSDSKPQAGRPRPIATLYAADSPRGDQDEEIAIIGLGCRFPGGVSTLPAFTAMLERGVDAVGKLGRKRWDAERYYVPNEKLPGRIYSDAAALLDDIDLFDPEFFGISPREAAGIDPHQRLLLEVTWEAFEDAGIVPSRLRGSSTGVFVGMMPSDYGRPSIGGNCDHVDGYYATGNDNSFASGRISYVFGLEGPSMTINTACSSALVALDAAVHQLRARRCDLAVVGAASLILTPELNVFLCNAGALSPDGRCRTFDDAANGFVRGEGAGAVVLRRLPDALSANDPIHAVIRSTAVNHGGRGAGLTVPNAKAQAALVRSALQRGGTRPSEVAYVEAHGTGTALGDPIEVEALGEVFDGVERKVVLGSVKTNIGHLDAAAGIAGLIKVCAVLSRETIPPPLHQRKLNSRVAWDRLALQVPRAPVAWPEGPRVAGVSAFGLGGTNAHAVVARDPRGKRESNVSRESRSFQRRPGM